MDTTVDLLRNNFDIWVDLGTILAILAPVPIRPVRIGLNDNVDFRAKFLSRQL